MNLFGQLGDNQICAPRRRVCTNVEVSKNRIRHSAGVDIVNLIFLKKATTWRSEKTCKNALKWCLKTLENAPKTAKRA
jgi:hypothetical protein